MIAGLGNPGKEYSNTPHNVGFGAVELLCKKFDAKWRIEPSFKSDIAQTVYKGDKLLFVRPMTYMNASGEAISSIIHYFRMTPQDIAVISDDVNLPPGRIRVRATGGAGGHNGLKSIIEHIGVQDFTRVRIGVGRGTENTGGLTSHVLGRISEGDATSISETIDMAGDAAMCALYESVETAMNRYNASPAIETQEEQESTTT